MSMGYGYWRAYFRFALPLMTILVVLDYLQRDHADQAHAYPWLQRVLTGIVISFIVPPIYIGAVNVWRRKRD
jgi:hypothetical protein